MNDKDMILLPAVPYAQSSYEGHEAANALDPDPETSWKAGPYYQWLMLDLQKQCFVSTINLLFPCSGGYYHYHIEYSSDRMNWHLFLEKADDLPESEDGESYAFDRECRYIRITISYCSTSSDAEIINVSVYGHECDPAPVDKNLRNGRVPAIYADEISGFEKFTAGDAGPGWDPEALRTDKAGAYLRFKDIDFSGGADQLRMFLGFPLKSKTHYMDIRIILDAVDGVTVSRLHICRQWLVWSEIAAELQLPGGDPVTGIHDLYIVLDSIDEPQMLQILFLELTRHPELSEKALDYKEDLRGEKNDDAEYHIYFGNMHCHTALSDGSATPEIAYAYARDIAGLDFLGITEHSNCLDEAFDCGKSRKFRDLKEKAEAMTENGSFVALYGSETTWYNQFGHMNIYCADFYLNSYEFKFDDPLAYYAKLKQYPSIISQWNHPWSCGNRHFDLFQPYDAELDKISYTVELNDIEMTEENVLPWYILALDTGWHVAPVGNQDNHRADWGTENGIRTGVIATHLTAGHIYDAMKNLRVYFTGAPGIRVLYRLNGQIQGSFTDDHNGLRMTLEASVESPHRFVRVDVYGEHGRIVYQDKLEGSHLNYSAELPKGERYYFIKLVREDNKYAVTAPVWIKAGE